jgi:flavin-dependent dehydrogenase
VEDPRLHHEERGGRRLRRGREAIADAVDGHTDVLVVGGGPAGSAASIRLLRHGRSVILLERSGYDRPRFGEQLSPPAQPVLAELIPDQATLTAAHGRSHGITMSWGDVDTRYTDYLFEPYGFGYRLDRARFDADLAAEVARTGGTLVTRTRATSIARADGGWTVTAVGDHGQTAELRARFLVDATGRAAFVGRHLGSRRRQFDRLIGVSGTQPPGEDIGERLVLESTETGWWYAIAMPSGQMAAVFMTDADVVRGRSGAIRDLWQRELQRTRLIRAMLPALPGRTRASMDPPTLTVRPADTSVLQPMHGDSWVAVGEAGVALDPLSGRGILDALESGLTAGTAVDRALDGETATLDEFARERRDQFYRCLAERREVYRQEQRWQESRFWLRRHRDGRSTARRSG